MEFSFGSQRWVPAEEPGEGKGQNVGGYALGLHAPGFFDKVLHVEKCLLQSEAANKVTHSVLACFLVRLLVSC